MPIDSTRRDEHRVRKTHPQSLEDIRETAVDLVEHVDRRHARVLDRPYRGVGDVHLLFQAGCEISTTCR